MNPIYLDYNATTPVDPVVADAMRPYIELLFGNPSSSHEFGSATKRAVEHARAQVAALINANPDEIIFTSGGTEANNMALKGAAMARKSLGNHIITSEIEHPAVLEVCRYLEHNGFHVTYLPVDSYGIIDPVAVESAITPRTILVSVMHANNEVGTVEPIEAIGKITKARGILLHTDAAQSLGKIPVDVGKMQVDLLSVAGHKLYAPKGIGALYVRRGVKLEKLMHGADHESNMRAGTENVAQIVALGAAAELLAMEISSQSGDYGSAKLKTIRDYLFDGIRAAIPDVRLNGHPYNRLPYTLSVGFPGVDASVLLGTMKGVAASAGAACHSDKADISGVLTAMQVPFKYAVGTVRFSLGRMTTRAEIDAAVPVITAAYERLSKSSVIPDSTLKVQGSDIRLTVYTNALGCACKIRPQLLEKILCGLPAIHGASVLVGHDTSDDAAVYAIDKERALVQTVDFIPPIVDDPYMYGAIAAANAISDVYAMGGTPAFALSIVGFPDRLLPLEVLQLILKGAADKAAEAGIEILGGHTIEDQEPKFGLVVTGFVHPDKILRNSTALPGDLLILTKPLGTGIIMTAMKRGLASPEEIGTAAGVMAGLNKIPAEIMKEFPVSACTDVTGFGLLGHLKEMVKSAMVSATVDSTKVPVIEAVFRHAAAGAVPGGTKNNLEFAGDVIDWDPGIPDLMKMVLCDAQTSGGLLISIPESRGHELLARLHEAGVMHASMIGKIIPGGQRIRVV